MFIYLVQSASDVTGRSGYGKAVLDAEHDRSLVTFADTEFNRRREVIPAEDNPIWNFVYDPPPPVAVTILRGGKRKRKQR